MEYKYLLFLMINKKMEYTCNFRLETKIPKCLKFISLDDKLRLLIFPMEILLILEQFPILNFQEVNIFGN